MPKIVDDPPKRSAKGKPKSHLGSGLPDPGRKRLAEPMTATMADAVKTNERQDRRDRREIGRASCRERVSPYV